MLIINILDGTFSNVGSEVVDSYKSASRHKYMKFILLTLTLLTLSLAPTYAHCGSCGSDSTNHKSTNKPSKAQPPAEKN